MTRQTWPSQPYPSRPDDTREMPTILEAHAARRQRRAESLPPAPRRITPERRAEKRRDALAMTIACLSMLVAIWALLIATAARDAILIGGLS